MLTAIIVVLQIVCCLALIFLILMHSGKGGGLSDMFGGSVGLGRGRVDGGGEEPRPDHRDRGRGLRLHQHHPPPAPAVSEPGAEPVARRPRISSLWRERRARWTLPLVIIVIIGWRGRSSTTWAAARSARSTSPSTRRWSQATGGTSVVHLGRSVGRLQPQHARPARRRPRRHC